MENTKTICTLTDVELIALHICRYSRWLDFIRLRAPEELRWQQLDLVFRAESEMKRRELIFK